MRILAVFAAGYSAAVFAAALLLPEGALLPLGGFCALAALAAGLLLRGRGSRRRRYALLCLAGAALGLVWTWIYAQWKLEPARALDGRTVILSGTVADWPQERDYGASVLLRAELEGGGRVNTLLYLDGDGSGLQPGDEIRTIAHCTVGTRSLGGEEITYYTAKGIFLTGVAYGEMELERPERVPLSCLPAFLSRGLKESIDACFAQDASPLIRALVTGNRDKLTDSYTSSLQRTGLSHVVAVSGMHLAFLAGMVGWLLGKGRRRTALVCLPVMALFSMVAGNTPSVVRAAIMIMLLQVAPLFDRERDDLTSLAFALMVLLIQNPYAAANIGLQLSFAAVAGIMLLAGPLQRRLLPILQRIPAGSPPGRLCRRCVNFVLSTFATTLGALVFTTPLTAVYFGTVSVIAPLSNLLTLWAVTYAFSGGLVVGLIGMACPLLGSAGALVVTPFARYLNEMIPLLSRASLASVPVTAYYLMWVVLVYGMLLLALVIPGKKRLLLPGAVGVAGFCVAVALTNLDFQAGEMTVKVLDVGQGQSVLFRCGSELALVDCGGDAYENAGDTAANQIQALGRSRLDLLVISHYHDDHANGVLQLLERVEVGQIALPDVEEHSPLRLEILEEARARQIPVLFVREDTVLELGGARFTLYPPLGEGDTNELGLTVLCSDGDFDVLLTGDMGSEVEALLLDHARLPHVEVMVAGHHGSKYANSDLLLQTVRPEAAVFSVGEDNNYGHPSPEAAQRFARVGAALYRTDRMGTVTVTVG